MHNFEAIILFILSIGVFGGMLGGYFFQKVKIPQVVGYIVIGVLLGETGIGIIHGEHIDKLLLFNHLALGVIGFLVGGELKIDNFRKYGKQYMAILFGEGLVTFVLVSLASITILYLVIGSISIAVAAGLILGAIASATDPASTIDVLWEYRSKGVLTTAVIAIVALDDALAMVLYGLGTGFSRLLTSHDSGMVNNLAAIVIDLGGACVVGGIAAVGLTFLIRLMDKPAKSTALSLGVVMLVITASIAFGLDLILASMTLGFALANLTPRRSRAVFELMQSFSVPIYAIFFVLVGARLKITNMPAWLWALVIFYVIFRSLGKYTGSVFAAKMTRAPEAIRRYLGSSLFAQGGVAIGLTIVASNSLSKVMITDSMSVGMAIVTVVTATTLIVQLIGPVATKFSIAKAGEINRDITEEDILESHTVADLSLAETYSLTEEMSIQQIVNLIQNSKQFIYPVTGKEGEVIGIIGMEQLKTIIAEPEQWHWLIVSDLMRPLREYCTPESSLLSVRNAMRKTGLNQMPVIKDGRTLVGSIDNSDIQCFVRQTLFDTHEKPLAGDGANQKLVEQEVVC